MSKESQLSAYILQPNILLGAGPENLAGVFAKHAVLNDHSVAYFTFTGAYVNPNHDAFLLDDKLLKQAHPYVVRANKTLHRKWPTGNTNTDNSLSRDSYIVRWCESIYTIGTFTDDSSLLKIKGNQAFACQMYVDRFLYDQEPLETCNLFMFDTKSETWWSWKKQMIRLETAPKPSGIYAVVGNSLFTRAAKDAIEKMWS